MTPFYLSAFILGAVAHAYFLVTLLEDGAPTLKLRNTLRILLAIFGVIAGISFLWARSSVEVSTETLWPVFGFCTLPQLLWMTGSTTSRWFGGAVAAVTTICLAVLTRFVLAP
jgi:hypothetical protein